MLSDSSVSHHAAPAESCRSPLVRLRIVHTLRLHVKTLSPRHNPRLRFFQRGHIISRNLEACSLLDLAAWQYFGPPPKVNKESRNVSTAPAFGAMLRALARAGVAATAPDVPLHADLLGLRGGGLAPLRRAEGEHAGGETNPALSTSLPARTRSGALRRHRY
jgi:hypothetical protein